MSSLQKYNNKELAVQEKLQETLNFSQLVVSGSPQLVFVERKLTLVGNLYKPIMQTAFKGKDQLLFNVGETLVKRFLNAFAFTQKLTADQVAILTSDALDHFKYEPIEDMVLFFKLARQGKFGTTKRSVDSNLIFGDWFPQFMELKAKAREKLIVTKQKQLNADKGMSMKDVEITYKKAQQQREQKEKQLQKQQFIDDAVKDLDKQGLEDLIFSWGKDKIMNNFLPLLKLKRLIIK